MKQKIEIDGRGVSSKIVVIEMISITVILMAIIAAFTFGLIGVENQYYKIQTENDLNKDFLSVKILNYTDNSPLPNVTLKVLEHGEGRLLSGPYITNESGYTLIQIPRGYDDYFDIVGEYKDVTYTKTIDKRPPLVKSEDFLGSLGIGLIIAFVGFVAGVVGWYLRGGKNKKALDTDEVPEKSEDKTIPEHQPDSPEFPFRGQ